MCQPALDGLGADLRPAIRRLLRTRGFTVVALGSLTLGMISPYFGGEKGAMPYPVVGVTADVASRR